MRREKKTRYALLGLLSIGPASGYALKQRIQHTTAHFWSESYGQIYPELAKLEEDGLVSSQEEIVEGQGPGVRRVYSVTSNGLEVLKQWLGEPPSSEVVRDEFLLKMFFGVHADLDALMRHMDKKHRELQYYAAYLTETARWVLNECRDNPHAPYWLFAVRAGVISAEAQSAELAKLREAFASGDAMQSHRDWLAGRPVNDIDPSKPINMIDESEHE
jgi:PadR family transcriptional regulator AphA